jgi:uncharacterized protein (DUF983 family)
MKGIKAFCPKCGAEYCGWGLTDPVQQKCDQCGSYLNISINGVIVVAQDRLFPTQEYRVDSDFIKQGIN